MALQIGIKTTIRLPKPELQGSVSLETAISKRRSVRSFQPGSLSITTISQLLWAVQGITGDSPSKRAAPSAGGRCPLQIYACWSEGVWLYHPDSHTLEKHQSTDIRTFLPPLAWEQKYLAEAGLVLAISAVYARTEEKYGERGRFRYVHMDAGHAAQNVLLQAVALGLASVPVGAFDDEKLKSLLQLPTGEEPLYLLPVGIPG